MLFKSFQHPCTSAEIKNPVKGLSGRRGLGYQFFGFRVWGVGFKGLGFTALPQILCAVGMMVL